jgi:hypothetical protein
MKRFSCACGRPVFFENSYCLGCDRPLGFDAESLDLLSLDDGGGFYHAAGASADKRYHHCRNRVEHDVCNWLVPAEAGVDYCLACGLNEVIPALDSGKNRVLWARLEAAKRRMLFDLLTLGLPLQPGPMRLSFRFLEDQRHNPNVSESFVTTGHMGGTITINVAEADDSVRHAVREDMQERYRTLLGHFRHESAHFYYYPLVANAPDALQEFRGLFGDERENYDTAMQRFYAIQGTRITWQGRYVSAYASSHPWEDWAETWAHYLHIRDTLETAVAWGIVPPPDTARDSYQWVDSWMDLSVILNELNRSMGTDDPYPFVLSELVSDKLNFVHRRVVPTPADAVTSATR